MTRPGVAILRQIHVHDLAEVADERAGLAGLDGLVEALVRGAHEPLRVFIDAADRVGLVQVAVETCVANVR